MKKVVLAILMLLMLQVFGCGSNTELNKQENTKFDSDYTYNETSYTLSENMVVSNNEVPALLADSLDTAVIESVNEENHTITFWNLVRGLRYRLSYDSATGIKDRYDRELVAGQIRSGDVVKVAFVKDERKVKNIWMDKEVTVIEDVTDFSIHPISGMMEIGDKKYSIDPSASIVSQDSQLDLMEINEADTLNVYAVDHNIISLAVANGHGYVRLAGAQSFEGGFVEFGQTIIRKVEADMLLVLPVGTYEMLISNNGNSGTKDVEVVFGQETVVDVSDLVAEEDTREGEIVFTITPSDAFLFIDGKETDYSSVVKLGYGIHQMKLKKEGYKTISQFIKVGQEMANIDIEMEKGNSTAEDDQNDNSTPTVSSNTISAVDRDYQVYIDAPVGAELYVDGSYVGILPTSFDKKAGNYTISLRRSGYITRSYSLEIDQEKKDVHYTFSQLQEDTSTSILNYAAGLF